MDLPGGFAKNKSCPCCKNPWSAAAPESAEGGGYENMKLLACDTCGGLDYNNLDTEVAPADNFYLYAVGGWKAKNEIPKE